MASKLVLLNYIRKQSQVNANRAKATLWCNTCDYGSETKQQEGRNASKWTEALSEADELLGHPDILTIEKLMPRSRLNTEHGANLQILKTFKQLVCKSNIQARGVINLLYAKAICSSQNAGEAENLIATKQSDIATVAEVVYCGQQIHDTVNKRGINLDGEDPQNVKKLAILIGDFLLARTFMLFGKIKNDKVTHMMCQSIREFAEGEFVFLEDKYGSPYPTESTRMSDWERKTFLITSSLLANSLESTATVSEIDTVLKGQAFEFGKKLGLAWQASAEWKSFVRQGHSPRGTSFSLVSYPIILHLERDASLLDIVTPFENDLCTVDYDKIHQIVIDSSTIDEAKQVCSEYVNEAFQHVQQLPSSAARTALENIVLSLKE